jgi:hypothetical protein
MFFNKIKLGLRRLNGFIGSIWRRELGPAKEPPGLAV